MVILLSIMPAVKCLIYFVNNFQPTRNALKAMCKGDVYSHRLRYCCLKQGRQGVKESIARD